jgi:hypothetical protein
MENIVISILKFIKEYWVLLSFAIGILSTLLLQTKLYKQAMLCSLRNDILEIWDKCKDKQTITRYQLESYTESRDLYFKKGGDGFVHALDTKIMSFKVVD